MMRQMVEIDSNVVKQKIRDKVKKQI